MSSASIPREENHEGGSAMAGTKDFPFKLLIVGGGPAGCSVIVRAIRMGCIENLCREDEDTMLAGLCIIDKSSEARFGGGRLQDYAINSNTYANKFASGVLDDKPVSIPPEKCTGTSLERLRMTENCRQLLYIGSKQGPLQVVGKFLHDVGACVSQTLAQYPNTCKCRHETNVTAVQRYIRNDGMIGWQVSIMEERGSESFIFAKDVLFATGGRQDAPVLSNSLHNCKVLNSDFVCTDEGIEEVRRRILKSSGGKKKVVIVGGSHSAFSAAWMCLNKLDLSKRSESPRQLDSRGFETFERAVEHVTRSSSPRSVRDHPQPSVDSGDDNGSTNSLEVASRPSSTKSPRILMSESSAIQLMFRDKDKEKDSVKSQGRDSVRVVVKTNRTPITITPTSTLTSAGPGPSDVLILHRSAIKVFYRTRREADYDRFYDIGVVNKSTGQIHPFGGLRGDSKALWRDMKNNRENRVRLVALRPGVDISSQSIANKLFDDAAVIVWACGYRTNICPVFESDGVTPIPLQTFRGQVEVDDLARILTSKPIEQSVQTIMHVKSLSSSSSSSNCRHGSSAGDVCDRYLADVTSKIKQCAERDDKDEVEREYHDSASLIARLDSHSSGQAHTLTLEDFTDSYAPEHSAKESATQSTNRKNAFKPKPPAPTEVEKIPPLSRCVGGLLGSGLGFGLKATLDNGEADGSSGRADGVSVYLQHGATLVLAHVLGLSVYGEGLTSWESRTAAMKRLTQQALAARSHSAEELLIGSDSEGLDNAYHNRAHSNCEARPLAPTNSSVSPPAYSFSPMDQRRRSESSHQQPPSPATSTILTSSSNLSDRDLIPLSLFVHIRETSTSTSAPPTSRRNPSEEVAMLSAPSALISTTQTISMPRALSPTVFTVRSTLLSDQQALAASRLSIPRTVHAHPKRRAPRPSTVFLDAETLQASVSRLSVAASRVALFFEVLDQKASPRQSSKVPLVASHPPVGLAVPPRKNKSAEKGKEHEKENIKFAAQPTVLTSETASTTPDTPPRSYPHRRAILQSEALLVDYISPMVESSSAELNLDLVTPHQAVHRDVSASEKERSLLISNAEGDANAVVVSKRKKNLPNPAHSAPLQLVLTPIVLELDLKVKDLFKTSSIPSKIVTEKEPSLYSPRRSSSEQSRMEKVKERERGKMYGRFRRAVS